jgi:phosphoribosylamine-glycine ligase
MKLLVINSRGREHALIWRLVQSEKVKKVYAAPGNGWTIAEEKTVYLSLGSLDPASDQAQKALLVFVLGGNVNDARTKAYEAIGFVNFEGMFYRRDMEHEQ